MITPLGSDERSTVAVMGACLTRDNFNSAFNPGWRERFDLVHTIPHVGVVSALSEPVDVQPVHLPDGGPWRPERHGAELAADLRKDGLARIAELQPAYLILDLYPDLFWGYAQLDGGPWLTANREVIGRTDAWQEWTRAGRLRRVDVLAQPELFLELWEPAFAAMVDRVRRESPATTIVLHSGQFADTVRLLDGREVPFQDRWKQDWIPIPAMNEWWRTLDAYASRLCDAQIDLFDRRYATVQGIHPWGMHYVHYELEFYPRFLATLIELDDYRRAMAVPSASA